MKKFTFALISLLALTFTVKAQQYVSTTPSNRNVVIEEFTGRNCGYCPIGHKLTHDLMEANPGRVWAINIHYQSSLSPTAYPNLNLPVSTTIGNAFPHNGIPMGVVNRSTASALETSSFTSTTNQQLAQAAECNVAGIASINPDTRIATITVEVYYTGNSSVDQNYLTVVMVQDSILGSQSDYGGYNPGGWLNGQYVHQHALRDIITPTWGDAITPTTAGTLITKTYEYQIPESIGNPNGVEVRLEHIQFLAFVTQSQQGTPTRPILNACELQKTTMTDEPLYPSISNVAQAVRASCSQVQSFGYNLSNIGTETITSYKYTVEVGDASQEFEWTGELASGDMTSVDFDMELPFGTFVGTINITEVNGQAHEYSVNFDAQCIEWVEVVEEAATTSLKIYIIQDQWGEHITWDIINSTGDLIAQGGPYLHLVGSGSTQANVENIENIPTNECYLFRIYDSNNNGICCNFGNGYYYIKDAAGNKIIEASGDYGAMDSQLISIKGPEGVEENVASSYNIYPNPANDKIYVEGEDVEYVELYNAMGQLMVVVKGSEKTTIDVTSYGEGVYFVKVVGRETRTQKVVIK